MAGSKIALTTTPGELQQDIDGNAKINLPRTKTQAGYSVLMGESHDGVGDARVVRPVRVSTDGRLRSGIDNTLWSDTFNHTVNDTGSYATVTSAATVTLSGGNMVFNAGNALTSGAVARVQTFRTFELMGEASLTVGFRLRHAINAPVNAVSEFGLGFATTTTTPTDGIYFKVNASGIVQGVVNYNGTERTESLDHNIIANEYHYYKIVIDQDRAEFYVDEVLQGSLTTLNTSPTLTFARQQPLLMRYYNAGALGTAQRMEVSDVFITQRDLANNKLWPTTQAGKCMSAINVPRGAAAGQTANYVNSTIPTSATLSNAAAGYTTLGGQFQFAAVAGAETDYALFAYQVPAAAAAGANKNLVVRGIRIEAFNMGAAVATTPHLLQWAVGVGSTAVTLAAGDSATAGTRAPRRLALGVQSLPVGAAIGAAATPIDVNLDAPLYVEAGTFLHVILKMPVATATASQIVRGVVMLNAYWE